MAASRVSLGQRMQASFPRRERLEPYFQCVLGEETFERLAQNEMSYWRGRKEKIHILSFLMAVNLLFEARLLCLRGLKRCAVTANDFRFAETLAMI